MAPHNPGNREKPPSAAEREKMAERWKELVKKFDAELRAKGLSDADREKMLQELLNEDDA